jgi:hypothetical protein
MIIKIVFITVWVLINIICNSKLKIEGRVSKVLKGKGAFKHKASLFHKYKKIFIIFVVIINLNRLYYAKK